MLHMETQVRTVQSEGIITVGTMDMNRCMQRLTQVPTDQILVAKLSTEGRTPPYPVEIAVQIQSIDITPIIIIPHHIRLSAVSLIAVTKPVPIDGRKEMVITRMDLCLNSRKELIGMLELVVSLPFRCSIRRAAAPPFGAHAQVPVHPQMSIGILSLVE